MNRTTIVTISLFFVGLTSTAYAAIPATYKGTSFDPAVAPRDVQRDADVVGHNRRCERHYVGRLYRVRH